jgi:hypothetical protein
MPKEDGRGKAIKHGYYAAGYKFAVEYTLWRAMRRRCTDPKFEYFKDYGGRGIKICKRWESFENFLADMGPRPSPKHTLDRRDNNKGYSPANCRWATRQEQASNRRSNKLFNYAGRTQTLKQWTEELGLDYRNVWQRIFVLGWTIEQALEKPVR